MDSFQEMVISCFLLAPSFIHLHSVRTWATPTLILFCNCLQYRRPRFDPWVGKIPWRKKWQLTPVFLPGKSHGWRSLIGYSPWGHKEWDMTERRHVSVLGDLALIGLMKVIISSYSHSGTQEDQVCGIFFPVVSKVFLDVKI